METATDTAFFSTPVYDFTLFQQNKLMDTAASAALLCVSHGGQPRRNICNNAFVVALQPADKLGTLYTSGYIDS